MSWRTNRILVWARACGRRMGVNRIVARLLASRGYEAQYDRQFSQCIAQGDCVWDVGANVGYYTQSFSERVGLSGKVFAFEPSLQNFAKLRDRCAILKNVQLMNIGLGSKDTTVQLAQGDDQLGATSRIVEGAGNHDPVSIRSGDSLLREGLVNAPNVLKIDVEGYEWEVIQGLHEHIRNPALTAIGVEVHFRLLQDRGDSMAPQRIERFLLDSGFTVTWPDSSHLLGTRKNV